MNLYEIILELGKLDLEIQELNEKLEKENKPTIRKIYMEEIDRKLAKFLEIKHIIQDINL